MRIDREAHGDTGHAALPTRVRGTDLRCAAIAVVTPRATIV